MVAPCAFILTSRNTELYYRYPFNGSFVNDVHYDDHHEEYLTHYDQYDVEYGDMYEGDFLGVDPLSSHGYELNAVGGHVDPDHYVDPLLAAGAYSGQEAVVQVDGITHIVPFD